MLCDSRRRTGDTSTGHPSDKTPETAAPARFSSSSRHHFAAVRMRQIAVLTFFCKRNIASHHRRVYSWNCLLHVSS
ncbi:hypothetical protein DF048_22980 [Burkholderia seminalis]|nr:hypothetical protein DF048_22980 [Burkholderia seminalis]